MENHVVNLQDKIQKLIDQYTLDKKKLEELERQNNEMADENLQLMQQVEDATTQISDLQNKVKALEEELQANHAKKGELENLLNAFDALATEAIQKIDAFVPDNTPA